jgi:aspartate aminotransferase-like enzyme
VTVVHSETSTATVADARAIAAVVRASGCDALLILDGITSVGAMPVEMDGWGIDALVTGSQKALMLPPGLGFVALGERAVARLAETDPPRFRGYNLDMRRWLKSWEKRDVPFTPPVSLVRAQRVALEMIEDEGLANVHQRTRRLADATRAAFAAMGLTLCSKSPSDSVSGAFYPGGVDDSAFRAAVRDRHGVHIAGGQDGRGAKWKGKILRVSHMGHVDAQDTLAGLRAIEAELVVAGYAQATGGAAASGLVT